MARAFAFLIIGLAFGGGIGFVLGTSSREADTETPAMEVSQHAHAHGEAVDVASGAGAPELDISLQPDPVAGWNLRLMTGNFQFAAERAGQDHVPGEGHAHVYVNGTKIARAYGEWFHLDALPVGPVEIEVTLTSNDHRALVVDGVPISAALRFENPG